MKNAQEIYSIVENKLLNNNNLDVDFLGKMLGKFESKNVDFADIYFENSTAEMWALDEQIVKSATYAIDQGFGVRGVKGVKTAFSFSSEVSPHALEQTVDVASTAIKSDKECKIKLSVKNDFDVLYPDEEPFQAMHRDYIVEIMREMDQYVRGLDPRVKNCIVTVSSNITHSLVAATDTGIAADIRPKIHLSCVVVVNDKGRVEKGHYSCGRCISYQWLTEKVPELPLDYIPGISKSIGSPTFIKRYLAVAREALRDALVAIRAEPMEAGNLPIVLGSGWPAVLIHEAVGHGLEADAIRKGTSAFKDMMGKKIASDICTIVDDGTIPERPGSSSIDSEGTVSKRNVLIEDGTLVKFMTDKLNARALGLDLTGNGRRESYGVLPIPRMTNTYLLPGKDNIEDMLASIPDGVYAVNFRGGQVDTATTKFTFSAREAYRIKNGKIVAPIKGITLIGNGLDVLKKVSMVGNNLELDNGNGACGKEGQSISVGVGQPCLKLDSITVGGTK